MRSTSLITISLPPTLLKTSEKIALKKSMTRSELVREALRHYIEEQAAADAIACYQQELVAGKLKTLSGSLSKLLK